jgi:two-component system KDP operon response regulator KdpE
MQTVLVVDDHPGILRALAAILTAESYRVITSLNGKEALKQVRKECLDLVLLDIRLPVMNGLEMLEKLREFSDVPVIANSADVCYRELALRAGADEFIAKPFAPDELLRSMRRLMSNYRLRVRL